MDKATPTPSLRQRCDTALQSLPDAAYKTMLAALFDDLLGIAAQAAPPMRLIGHCWMEPRGTLRLAETDPPPAGSFPIYTPSQAIAQSAPLAQQAAREYPPLPEKVYLGDDVSYGYDSESLRDYVDADRAAAQVEPRRRS